MASRPYQVVINGSLAGQYVANVLNFALEPGDGDPGVVTKELLVAVENSIFPAFLDCLPVSYHITSTKAKRVSAEGGPTAALVYTSTDYPGTRTGEVSTTAEGPVVLAQGFKSPRWVSAKIFLAGVSETDITANVFGTTLLGKLATLQTVLASDFVVGDDTATGKYTIFRRSDKSTTQPTNFKTSSKPGTQRRRLVPIV